MGHIDLDQVFNYICRYKRDHDGIAPSYRDLMAACEMASTSVAVYTLQRLERMGKIKLSADGKTRQIQVVGAMWLSPSEAKDIITSTSAGYFIHPDQISRSGHLINVEGE